MAMNKRLVAVVIVLVVVIGGTVGAFALSRVAQPTGSTESTETSAPPSPAAIATDEPVAASTPGVYVEYTDTAIADAQGKVVLFFHAPWCGQCVQLEKGILADGVPDGVTIIKVDWDTNQELEAKYGVPMRTTFVELDSNGEVVQRLNAYDDPRFEAVVETMNL